MNKISAVFLVLIFAAVGFTGFAVASDVETPDLVPPLSVLITDVSDFNYGIPSEMKVYHPLSLIFFDADVTPLEALSSLVWLPADITDGNPGLYYEKTLIVNVIPEIVSYFSAF